jgi:hypothetical protein
MARLNEILVGRFNRSFQKLFGIKGPAPVSTLAPEVMPVHLIPYGVEGRWPETWTRWSFSLSLAATAGQTTGMKIRNPVGSNVIGVVEKVTISTVPDASVILGVPQNLGDYTSITAVAPMDTRQGPPGVVKGFLIPSFQLTSPGSPAILEIVQGRNQPQSVIQFENNEIPVPPGSELYANLNVQNVQFNCVIQWRERFLEEGERL